MYKIGTDEIVDNLPGMVARVINDPPSYTFTLASQGCKALTGYTPEELTKPGGVTLIDMVHPNDVQALTELCDVTLSKGIPLDTALRLVTKTGAVKTVWMRCRVIDTDSVGMPYLIEGFYTDITELMSNETTKFINNAKSDFFNKMGNEVRTSANAILGMTELGLREDMPVKMREYTHIIREAGEKMVSALDNLVDYSKIENNSLTIYEEEYVLPSLVNDIVNTIKARVAGANLKFTVHVDSRMPNMLVGDVVRLRQAILCIMSNAVKFTDEGVVSLSIDGEASGDTINLIITVEDTGRGIKEENIDNILKAYVQFDKKTIEGLGLGLAIADGLVRLMGGVIHVSSMYGLGSIFLITLPQRLPDCDKATTSLPMCKVNDPQSKRVLIFDKRENCVDSIVRSLENLGVPYDVAATDSDFYSQLESGDFKFAFIPVDHCNNFKEKYSSSSNRTRFVLIADIGETPPDCDRLSLLTMPIYSLPVADILNDKAGGNRQSENKQSFIAPDAKVLVVDDISANLAVAEGLLQPYKMQLDLCRGGVDAVEAVKSNKYDLILMDHMMPVMNGVEATKHIRELGSGSQTDCENVPIVVLTANAVYASRGMVRQNGFDDYLAKPIEIVKLHEIIEKWIPRDKQIQVQKADIPEQSGAAAPSEPGIKIDGLNVSKGISLTGGALDTYLKVVKTYYENGNMMLKELKSCADSGSIELYGIHVHALKGISGSIGADNIQTSAEALETAAERGDIEFIRANNPKLLADLQIILDNINKALFKSVESQTDDKEVQRNSMDQGQKKKILLIDDSDSFILILNSILKDDYETLISLDGEDGLDTARVTKPDLILLDVVMPGMSGYEVLETLKADDTLQSIPVILISGKSSEESEAKGYALGAAGYIKKPFEKAAVKDMVDSVLAQGNL